MPDEPRPISERMDALAARFEDTERPTLPSAAVSDEVLARMTRAQAWRGSIPSRFQWAKPDDLDPEVAAALVAWASPDVDGNLVLLGPTGSGKTHAAVAAARARFDRGLDVEFMPVVELLRALRPSTAGDEDLIDRLSYADVLILDDLGAEKASEWTTEQVFQIVNRRWMECLPTVVTSNLVLGDFAKTVGARTFSRLVGSGATVVPISGEDRRLDASGG